MRRRFLKPCHILLMLLPGILGSSSFFGQPPQALPGQLEVYDKLKAFRLDGTSVRVEKLELRKDRLEMSFTGSFYFAEPVEGGVLGAVFLGEGRLRMAPPPGQEQEAMKRFVSGEWLDATFTKAVLRFSDYTYNTLAGLEPAGPVPPEARQLAASSNDRLIRETGLNIASRLLTAMRNHDEPGVFYAEFDGGREGRFSALLDHQARSLSGVFGIDGGEKGLLFKYNGIAYGYDVWTAFHSQEDIQRRATLYSDTFDLVSIPSYRLEIDLRDPGDRLRLNAGMQIVATADNVRVLPMRLNEGLRESFNERRDYKLRVLDARLDDGASVGVIQEDWENGFSLVLPRALTRGQSANLTVRLEGRRALKSYETNFYHPRSITTWYPRHGQANRSRFELEFRHERHVRVAAMGRRIREGAVEGNSSEWLTEWAIKDPVSEVTFVSGAFERHQRDVEPGGASTPIEYYSLPSGVRSVDEKFILTEIDNALRYFGKLFGDYSYGRLVAAYSADHFGEGFPGLLLLQTTSERNIAGISHAAAHQWWGSVVGWRSYRDQWLSDGFAEYSRILYADARLGPKDTRQAIDQIRFELTRHVPMATGVSKQALYGIGPLILGHRLNSSRSIGAQALNETKGALVLRMIHFLLLDPGTGTDTPFREMMKDFVNQHRTRLASTESFIEVASSHFARSPLGRRLGLKDLNWFMAQWIYGTGFPSYRLDYRIEQPAAGGFVLKGDLLQQGVPDSWLMPVPVVFELSGNRKIGATIVARGPKVSVEIALPERPRSVTLDPDRWILADRTLENRR